MSLLQRITEDLKAAMKAKDAATLSTLRLLQSALKNRAIELRADLSEEDALAVIKSQMKQLKDSLDAYAEAGREEAAEALRQELRVLGRYLPAQMDDAELDGKVKAALAEAGIEDKADMGRAMGAAMKAVGGAADGSRVKAAVERSLSAFAFPFVFAGAGQELFLTEGLRVFRVFLMLAGLVAVMQIMRGGFTFLTASGRSATHQKGLKTITGGVVMSIVAMFLFLVATVWIGKVGA